MSETPAKPKKFVGNVPVYEYIRLEIDTGDLDELNGLSSIGFHIVATIGNFAILERQIGWRPL